MIQLPPLLPFVTDPLVHPPAPRRLQAQLASLEQQLAALRVPAAPPLPPLDPTPSEGQIVRMRQKAVLSLTVAVFLPVVLLLLSICTR